MVTLKKQNNNLVIFIENVPHVHVLTYSTNFIYGKSKQLLFYNISYLKVQDK